MRKSYRYMVVYLFLSTVMFAGWKWNEETIISSNSSQEHSVALDSSGALHILASMTGVNKKLLYFYKVADTWMSDTIETSSSALYPGQIALDIQLILCIGPILMGEKDMLTKTLTG